MAVFVLFLSIFNQNMKAGSPSTKFKLNMSDIYILERSKAQRPVSRSWYAWRLTAQLMASLATSPTLKQYPLDNGSCKAADCAADCWLGSLACTGKLKVSSHLQPKSIEGVFCGLVTLPKYSFFLNYFLNMNLACVKSF